MNDTPASALTRLREMILRGALQPGERLLELELADTLAISRTPIRQALPVLAQEGLLVPAGGRGYRVREFTRRESLQALQLRAMLEGFAARSIVVAGRGQAMNEVLAELLSEGDDLLGSDIATDALEERFGILNARFHDLIISSAEDLLLTDLIARCNIVPFTAPGSIAFEGQDEKKIRGLLSYAHQQHHAIADAFASNDALRVEMLFREHATTQEYSMAMRAPPPPSSAKSKARKRT